MLNGQFNQEEIEKICLIMCENELKQMRIWLEFKLKKIKRKRG